jgi:hypothetical protein
MATANNTSLPPGIEIFKAGRHIDDAGEAHVFSNSDLEEIAAGYNPAVREAPLCVGHPASNLPSYGWVSTLLAKDHPDGFKRLEMDTRDVEPQFAEMVGFRRFPKRSAAFYHPSHPANPTPGKWYLRHVAFLGAQPPAVAGLKDIQFSEGDNTSVNFSEPVLPEAVQQGHVMHHPSILEKEREMEETEVEKAQREAADARREADAARQAAQAAQDKLAQFAEAARTERHAGYVQFAEEQVRAGRVLPKDAETLVAVMDTLGEIKPVQFSEAGESKTVSPAEFLKDLIASGGQIVNFNEFAGNKSSSPRKPMTDAEADLAARKYAVEHNVSYAEAIDKVCAFSA